MGSSSSSPKPDLSENELAMARQKKLDELLVKWYQTVIPGPPPPSSDPNLLRYETKTDYCYTSSIFNLVQSRIYDPPPDWFPPPPPKISVDEAAVNRTIASALNNTTPGQTGEGAGTCIVKSFDGKYYGDPCLFKLIVVAVSFRFSASEYKTSSDVAAFAYWMYFFRTDPPFRYGDREDSKRIQAEPFAYKVPNDVDIVGKKYMTVKELDQYNP